MLIIFALVMLLALTFLNETWKINNPVLGVIAFCLIGFLLFSIVTL